MNLAKSKAKYLKYAILIILLCFMVGVISANIPFIGVYSQNQQDNDILQSTRYDVTYDDADSLGKLQDNAMYIFTDKNLVKDYRAGTESSDTMIIYTSASTTHGSQTNPYVIADKSDWQKFLIMIEKDASHGAGKFFLLINSIDFAGETFYPLRFFKGTFYGLGNSFKNISISNWNYLNNNGVSTPIAKNTTYGYGVFCQTNGATITDFIVENFSYAGPQEGSAPSGYSVRNIFMGGVVGYSVGDDAVLNCHTTGVIN
ncbi:MAG: hypothetical protein K2L53_04960, partial [Clostridia bacterium]|nr:hypothetical protein [Clostridia bacterium]